MIAIIDLSLLTRQGYEKAQQITLLNLKKRLTKGLDLAVS